MTSRLSTDPPSPPVNPARQLRRAVGPYPLWLLGPLWTLIWGGALWAFWHLDHENRLFATEGEKTRGQITQKWITTSHGGKGGPTHHYHIQYTYTAGHMTGSYEATLLPETWDSLAVGNFIPIVYLRDRPTENRFDTPAEERRHRTSAELTLAAALAILGLGGWGLWYAHGQNTLFRWLGDAGTRCIGRVLELVDVNTGKGSIRTYLKFSFTTEAGEYVCGRTDYLGGRQLQNWRTNSGIYVWYNPAQPEQFTVNVNEPART